MSEPKYKEMYQEKIYENIKNFNVNSIDVKKKIENFCSKFNFEQNQISKKLQKDEIFRVFFIKDPSKQNIYEKTFSVFLENIKGVTEFKKLPTSGNNATFIINQEVRKKENSNKSITSQSKSMDFSFKYDNIDSIFYVFHKYTNESGGAQDNQKNDVINAIDKASNPHINSKIFVLFICDGEYYNNKVWSDVAVHIKDKNFKLLKSNQIENFLLSLK